MHASPIPHEALGEKAARLLGIDFPSAYTRLVPGSTGSNEAQDLLSMTRPRDVVAGVVVDEREASCALAGLWLWHDFLDTSHTICQEIETASGSYWHAILHRREGDFSNAKYWFRRVGPHPAMQTLLPRATAIIHPAPADKLLLRLVARGWDAMAFVDLVEAVHDDATDPRHAVAVALQRAEWETLFAHNLRAATTVA